MEKSIRSMTMDRFFSYYYFFTEKVIAICGAHSRMAICTML